MQECRIIRNPQNDEDTMVPTMPIVIAFDDGRVGEAMSLKGAVALIVGEGYMDSEDDGDEYLMRLRVARKFSMEALKNNKNFRIYNEKENYSAAENDPDYELDEGTVEYIRIETEKLFLLSLERLNCLNIYEKGSSSLIRPNEDEDPSEYISISEYDIDIIMREEINNLG